MCWCGAQQQQQQQQLTVTEDTDANSTGRTKSRAAAALEGLAAAAARRTLRDDNSLCCCMCGSLCPAECHACFHVVCSDYSTQHLCQWSTKGHALPGQVHSEDKPVSEWTSLNVVEWMSALNLYRYADVFKSKDIKGSDLLHLDRDKLMLQTPYAFTELALSRDNLPELAGNSLEHIFREKSSKFRCITCFGISFGNFEL
ncbi:hypothetical protein EAI_12782 [Harpegnathos saltator]|uniref:SAM domain-containing protein n=1 Tax=Harpegnathos saltator TaxID=610380 RepID=E2B924_HARSA|nr:hypothetical protein EAI_12782 [Harpegnathos saltator]